MCPVHRRHQWLALIASRFERLSGEKHIFYFLDRATDEVARVVDDIVADSYDKENLQVHVTEAAFPFVSDREYWPEARNWQLEKVRQTITPDYCSVWDDDMVLTDPDEFDLELPRHDLLYGPKLFLWNRPTHYNARFDHCSAVAFKHEKDDAFPLGTRQIHATKRVHDDPGATKYTLTTPILDYGFMLKRERLEVFERHKRAGRIDRFSLLLVEKSDTRELPDDLKRLSLRFAK
jgi:hypothetical protein